MRDLGLTHKNDLRAVEEKRPEVAAARHIWITRRQPFMANLLTRIGFIDETSVKTNMARTTGWAPRGARLVDHAPFGHSLPGNLLESKVFDYDILPQMPIILGAGGVVSDWDGQPFGAASSYVTVRMAANADLQAATLERLRMS